jgi:hypothetical protein
VMQRPSDIQIGQVYSPPAGVIDPRQPAIRIRRPHAQAVVLIGADGKATLEVQGTTSAPEVTNIKVIASGKSFQASSTTAGWAAWQARVEVSGEGKHLIVARAVDAKGNNHLASVEILVSPEPARPPLVERLLIVEKVRLSTYLGAYGPGRTVKTISLLPGEKTKVAVKTFRRSSETETDASSILDSYTEESQEDFEDQLASEQSSRELAEESSKWEVSGKVRQSWGTGRASIEAGAEGSSNASREELAKTVATAVHKHAAKASSKRDVEVKSTREMKTEEGEEYSAESEIQNINVSRTLNFVFRQMNQEFLTILHLVDVRVAYVRGDLKVDSQGTERVEYTYTEVALSQLQGLLERVLIPERVESVRKKVLSLLGNVFDYEDEVHSLIDERTLEDENGNVIPNSTYIRVPKNKTSTFVDPATGTEIVVPGVILAVMKNVMRTDGVVCDAILGSGDALDTYARGLQVAELEARRILTKRERAALRKDELALKLVRDKDTEAARVFGLVHPEPQRNGVALVTVADDSRTSAT